MFNIEQKAADAAKRAGLVSGGLILCCVGVAFLTLASWIALLPLLGALSTALTIAAIYLGLGLIALGIGLRRSATPAKPSVKPATPAETPGGPVIQAFMYGLQAGGQAEKSRR